MFLDIFKVPSTLSVRSKKCRRIVMIEENQVIFLKAINDLKNYNNGKAEHLELCVIL